MNDIEKRARELLAAEFEKDGATIVAEHVRGDLLAHEWTTYSIRAIVAALTPPEGYVLVPVEPTEEMLVAGYGWQSAGAYLEESWKAMVEARPEIKS